MYKATINEKAELEVEKQKSTFLIDGEPMDLDFATISPGYFHIIHKNTSYRAEVVKADYDAKAFTFKINGQLHEVALKDKFDLLLEKLGMSDLTAQKVTDIKAPMPGLILEIIAKVGQEVSKGDPIMILEAMKMENVLKSPGDGVINAILVKQGQSVEKNQVLIQF